MNQSAHYKARALCICTIGNIMFYNVRYDHSAVFSLSDRAHCEAIYRSVRAQCLSSLKPENAFYLDNIIGSCGKTNTLVNPL
jgi:hypothetical protein